MRKLSLVKLGWILLGSLCLSEVATSSNQGSLKEKEGGSSKDSGKSASSNNAKTDQVWSPTTTTKTALKRETLPIPSSKGGRSSSESLRTASQTLFGYNGANNNGYNGFGSGGQFGGVGGGGGVGGAGGGFNGFSGYPGDRQFGGFGQNGYNQYSQLGNQGYNVLGQGSLFGGQGGQYYPSNGYFGGNNGYNQQQYNPYASTGGAYPFGGLSQGGFGGGFGGFNSGFNSGYYPGGGQFQGQVGNRNFGFINQGFGNPAFRNPQAGSSAISGGSSGINSLPTNVQVGTGLEVGSRGFGSNGGSIGGFPSASGQQYIVGNGIGQPAFIGGMGLMSGGGAGGSPGFGGPFNGLYSPGIPGGLYRQQMRPSNSLFGLGPYDYPRTLSSPSPSPSARPGSTKLQTAGANRFYQGISPAGTYAPNSRERLYRYTSNES